MARSKGVATPDAGRRASRKGTAGNGEKSSKYDLPTIGPQSRRQSGLRKAVKNSSDASSDLEHNPTPKPDDHISRSSARALRRIEILSVDAGLNSDQASSEAPSSIFSLQSTFAEDYIGFDTPATSAAVTPAGLVGNETKSGLRYQRSLRGSTLNSTSTSFDTPSSLATGKRKRVVEKQVEVQLVDDEQLALALQHEEYEQVDTKPPHGVKKLRPTISDSDADHDSLTELSDRELSELEAYQAELRAASKAKLARSTLPLRSARMSAKKSLAATASLEGQDDEESVFSLSGSDLEGSTHGTTDMESPSETEVSSINGKTVDPSSASTSRRSRANARSQPRSRVRRTAGYNRAAWERAKLQKAHPEIKTLWQDLEKVPLIVPVPAPQPTAITRTLKSFQLEGLNWMCRQEKSQWKGGLLGDEMGMGKTIQAVSLIMSDYPAKDPTLVVVPPVALMQWSAEIKAYTDGKLKVLVHHNTDSKVKSLTMAELKRYDVIMISYSGLESMYRKESKGWKRGDGMVKENSKIHAIKFHRLILDEAHNIKQRTTGVAKACFALKADFKWCLSGTPVQNRIGEFFSLLRFLEVRPFASYFCKACSCAELHWSQDEEKKCTHCGHSGFSHVSIFNQELLNPITQAEDPELRRDALGKLRLITDRIMLRRLKRDHTASMELPPKEVIIHNEFFGEIERDFSSSIMTNTNRQFDTYVSRGVMLNNYANIFGLIMQMRQVANHPDLILKKHANGGQNVLVCCICDEVAEEPIRSRCHHEFCRKCAKDFVRSFENLGDAKPDCPRCHIPLTIDFDQPDIEQDEEHVKKNSIINRIKMEDWTSSTKIEMLIYDLYKLRSKKQTNKSIVFSQFTSMLQLVEWRLRRAGFNTVMLDGSMSPAQRQRSIEYFMNNVDVEVFLVSLKAGGVALNLTEASRVFIIDPWWNPAAEWQSADRCHRIGQKRPCVITRLCIEDSVESRMVMLQEKKANMINGTINNDQVAMEKLTPEDMQFLFRGS